jgi:hypothetical protein
MDAYYRCTNLGEKNLADIVALYGRGRELFRPPTYLYFSTYSVTNYIQVTNTKYGSLEQR